MATSMIQGTWRRFGPVSVGVLAAGYDDDGLGWARFVVSSTAGREHISLRGAGSARMTDGTVLSLSQVRRPAAANGLAVVDVDVVAVSPYSTEGKE